MEKIHSYEQSICSSVQSLNQLTEMVALFDEAKMEAKTLLHYSRLMQRVFLHLKTRGDFEDHRIKAFVNSHFKLYRDCLIKDIKVCDNRLKAVVLVKGMMGSLLIKEKANEPLQLSLFQACFKHILEGPKVVINEFIDVYVKNYSDISLMTIQSLNVILKDEFKENVLLFMPYLISARDQNQFFYNAQDLSVFPSALNQLWLNVLSNSLDPEFVQWVLKHVHTDIFPFITQPCLFMDFLVTAFEVYPLLSLQGLFVLITEYNLDFSDFYNKVYSLLDSSLFHKKYRFQFFELLDLFLQSSKLPNYLVASFIKRCARLSLMAPPSSLLWLIPFIYNLLQRFPLCKALIQKDCEQQTDPYNHEEMNVSETRALESSLWELIQLESHYHPDISSLAKIFRQRMTKPMYPLKDFINYSYSVLLKEGLEMKKKVVLNDKDHFCIEI